MKNFFKENFKQSIWLLSLGLLVFGSLFPSCDTYTYEDKEPEWLGASVYDYLKTDGHFNNFTRLVQDLNYTEVLSKTGSKTLFVANDSAFSEFYKNNSWGITSYDQLTIAQKKLILNFSMINNSYQTGMLANYYSGSLQENAAFRRNTAINVLDSLPFNSGDQIPNNSNWDYYRNYKNGLYLLKDNTAPTAIYLTRKFLNQALISNEDFTAITGKTRDDNDVFMFDTKVVKPNITCKNGYLNLLDKVMIPPVNMAQYIYDNKDLSIFSSVLERFSVPNYDVANTILYRQSHPDFTDSIFVKKYFGSTRMYANGKLVPASYSLSYDPGNNSYANGAIEADMAAMLVPTDDAMKAYFNSGAGAILKDRFVTWDGIPLDILALFINRHLRTSFLQTIPSRFSTMVDKDNSLLNASKSDIQKSFIACNGIVYQTNKVYPPDDYASVYGPVVLSANDNFVDPGNFNKTKIWNTAIKNNDFRLYLNSMISKYSFFVPTDGFFQYYIDPVAIGKDVPCALRYGFDNVKQLVYAAIYKYDKDNDLILGDSIGVIVNQTLISNRLLDLLNSHIVVGDVESGKHFYISKGNVAIRVDGTGTDMTVMSGNKNKVNVRSAYHQSNGNTYFIDRPIPAPLKSVYKVLSETPEFSSFFTLLTGFPATGTGSSSAIFANKKNYYGVDFVVKFFNTFNYTLYIPTNEAINRAISERKIDSWDSINVMTNATQKAAAISNLERFIRYHFQDNSVFVDNYTKSSIYQSATMKTDDSNTYFNTFRNKYYKIGVECDDGSITLKTENQKIVHVLTNNGLYNILTRDYVFNNTPTAFKEVDGTGTGVDFNSSLIYTSSTAVIHQIDDILEFK
jgi:uncharacterized surface protein with fasciclin (FAS1) repeats